MFIKFYKAAKKDLKNKGKISEETLDIIKGPKWYELKVSEVLSELKASTKDSYSKAVRLVADKDKKLALYAADRLIDNKWLNKVENGAKNTPYEEVAMHIMKRFIELKEWYRIACIVNSTVFYDVAKLGISFLIKNKRNDELKHVVGLTRLSEKDAEKIKRLIE